MEQRLRRPPPLTSAALLALAVVALASPAEAAPAGQDREHAPYEVALLGDLPYTPAQEEAFDRLIELLNAQRLAFTIHDGDIKGSGTECTDQILVTTLERFERFQRPLVYTPGDNEWTDCHRILRTNPASPFGDPLERLAALRRVFFADPGHSLGRHELPVQSQASEGYPENARWRRDPVTFATLHVVGSNDNLPLPGTEGQGNPEEHAARRQAVLRWLRATFDEARTRDDRGVVLVMQANPNFELLRGDAERSGFESLLAALREETEAFDGDVVLVHGDTHYFRVDKPLRNDEDAAVANFTRVETFGSPDVHGVLMTVDPRQDQLFTFRPEILRTEADVTPPLAIGA